MSVPRLTLKSSILIFDPFDGRVMRCRDTIYYEP